MLHKLLYIKVLYIFGISLDDVGDCVRFGRNQLGQQYYISERIRKTWKRGHVIISDVSWHTCAYVARYVTKKLNDTLEDLYGIYLGKNTKNLSIGFKISQIF